jgi:serine/threonine-protein kinase RsbW
MTECATDVYVTIPSDFGEGHRVQDEIIAALESHGYGERDVFSVRLALEEAIVNAIKHGNQMDTGKRVHIRYRVTPELIHVRIEDEGDGFCPAELPDPTAPENMEKLCGRGVHLIRGFMTSVEYHGCGNIVTMTKSRSAQT